MRISDWSSDVCSSDLGGNDGRALAAFEQPGDVGLARGLGFGVEAVVAFGVLAVAGELVEAGAGPDVRRYPKILVAQFGGGDHLAQAGSPAPPLDHGLDLFGLAGVLYQCHPLLLFPWP